MNELYFMLTVYGALAVSIGFSLWVYLTLNKEIARLRAALREQGGSLTADLNGESWANRRREILALAKDGIRESAIAAQLRVPVSEVSFALRLSRSQPQT